MTPRMLRKAVQAGANNGSYALASAALEQRANLSLTPKQIRRVTVQAGEARLAERDEAVQQLKDMPLSKRRVGGQAKPPPGLAVISMDGGRYLTRMNDPEYRQQGLPLTSSHIESTIKQINGRIKGTEKFRRRERGDAVLQLRADSLSDSQPLASFWRRWQAQQNGANSYHTATRRLQSGECAPC